VSANSSSPPPTRQETQRHELPGIDVTYRPIYSQRTNQRRQKHEHSNHERFPERQANEFGVTGRDEASADNIETALARNRAFAAASGHAGAVVFPSLSLFVITCLDP
jgi:hypothetical protein